MSRRPRASGSPAPPDSRGRAGAWCTTRLPLLLAALLVVPGLLEQFEVPKTWAVRVCGLAAFAWFALAGRRTQTVRWWPIAWTFVAWLLVEAIATFASVSPLLSLYGEPEQLEGLFTSLALIGVYRAARGAARVPGERWSVLTVWLIGIALASAYAIAQSAGLDPFRWQNLATAGESGAFVRPGGTLGHPNLLGVMSAAAAVAAGTWAVLVPRRRALHVVIAGLCALALVLTLSRGAWLGAGAGAALAAVLAWRARAGTALPRRALAVGGLAALAIVALVLLSPARAAVQLRFEQLFSTGGSSASRIEIWRTATAAWLARPITGHGPDTFFLVFPRFQTPAYWRFEWGLVPLHAHSIYLHALATRGVLGLLALLGLGAAIVATMRRAWSTGEESRALVAGLAGALLAVAVAGAFGAIGINGALFVAVACGVLAGASGAITFTPASGGRLASFAAIVVAVLVLLWGAAELTASRNGAWARRAMAGEERGAAAAAARAARLDPHDDLYPTLEAQALLGVEPRAPDFGEANRAAEQAARRAIALTPRRAMPYQTLAYVLAARAATGDSAQLLAADSAFARAIVLAPADGTMLSRYARFQAAIGHPERGLTLAHRAAEAYPDEGALQETLSQFFVAAGDTARARAALVRAVAGAWHGDRAGQTRAALELGALGGAAPRP